jgi:hypothetical protein
MTLRIGRSLSTRRSASRSHPGRVGCRRGCLERSRSPQVARGIHRVQGRGEALSDAHRVGCGGISRRCRNSPDRPSLSVRTRSARSGYSSRSRSVQTLASAQQASRPGQRPDGRRACAPLCPRERACRPGITSASFRERCIRPEHNRAPPPRRPTPCASFTAGCKSGCNLSRTGGYGGARQWL